MSCRTEWHNCYSDKSIVMSICSENIQFIFFLMEMTYIWIFVEAIFIHDNLWIILVPPLLREVWGWAFKCDLISSFVVIQIAFSLSNDSISNYCFFEWHWGCCLKKLLHPQNRSIIFFDKVIFVIDFLMFMCL